MLYQYLENNMILTILYQYIVKITIFLQEIFTISMFKSLLIKNSTGDDTS